MGKQPKIASAKIQNRILDLYNSGEGYVRIKNTLAREDHQIMSVMTIKRFIARAKGSKSELMGGDERLKKMVKDRVIDIAENIKEANNLILDIIHEANVTRRFKLQTVKQLMEVTKMADHMLNEFRGLQIKQGPQSKLQITQVIMTNLNELEKKGDIIIVNPRLKNPELVKEVIEYGRSRNDQGTKDGGSIEDGYDNNNEQSKGKNDSNRVQDNVLSEEQRTRQSEESDKPGEAATDGVRTDSRNRRTEGIKGEACIG